MNNAGIPINSLEFDAIKQNLKNYLRSQSQFKDYDFEGSTLSILMDLLAYNTHYQAFYANMAANESFLDSATVRPSVVSLAKHLDYVPRSKKAATLVVDLLYKNDSQEFTDRVIQGKVFLTAGNYFRGVDQRGRAMNFVNLDTQQVIRRRGQNIALGVTLSQGTLKSSSYIANTAGLSNGIPVFTIKDKNIDIDTLTVRVQANPNDNTGAGIAWNRARDITVLNGDSRVFFVQEGIDGYWQFYFGDGVIGRAILNGNLITANYLVTAGSLGNFIGYNDDIKPTSAIENLSVISVRRDSTGTVITSFGGEDEESIDSIKFYAPRTYQAQERAVTADDYKAILGREYSQRADSFFVWGGEENIPPQYGKVFISIKPKQGRRLSFGEKQAIERTVLGDRNLMTITPEVVDPDFLYIQPTVTVYYDESKTTANNQGIVSAVRSYIDVYNTTELGGFSKDFRTSKLSSLVNSMGPSMNSNDITIKLAKVMEPNLGQVATYRIAFDNPINHPIDGYPPIMTTESFVYEDPTSSSTIKPKVTAFMEDDGYGNVRIYKLSGTQKVIIKPKIGTIDYETGLIVLQNFKPESLEGGRTEIKITVEPKNRDVFSRRNQILEIDSTTVSVVAVPEKSKIYGNSTDSAFTR